jgi:hypothetical protein
MTPPLKKDGLLYLYYVCIYVCVGLKDWPLIYNIDMNTSPTNTPSFIMILFLDLH